jgi:cell division protein ZapE
LLAALWHRVPEPKRFCTFVELTHFVGVLGFADAIERLADTRLLCIDEFELDDPGDTVLMSSLLMHLVERGVNLAATSNTLPGKLGEGRFAADDFLREIQQLSAHFDVLRVDGDDYRHRELSDAPEPLSAVDLEAAMLALGRGAALDDFGALLAHLGHVHPSRYGALLSGVDAVGWRGVRTIDDQAMGLRMVVLVDRLYDRGIVVYSSGERLDQLFSAELVNSGYRKKYLRALSRIVALAHGS